MSLRHAYGTVNANGSKNSGSDDWAVVAEGNDSGEYTIIFQPPFNETPAVVTDQNYPGWNDFSSNGGYLTDNTVIIALNRDKCKVKTGGGETGLDRNFTFIAVGQ